MERQKPISASDRPPIKLLAPEMYDVYHNDFLKQTYEKYARPVEIKDPVTLLSRDFTQIEHDNKMYFYRSYGTFDEAILLDDKNREVAHWRNWDRPDKSLITKKLDSEGYIVETEDKKGSGAGVHGIIHYQQRMDGNFFLDKKGYRIPKTIVMQRFIGNPSGSWGGRTLVRGKDIGEAESLDLTSYTQ